MRDMRRGQGVVRINWMVDIFCAPVGPIVYARNSSRSVPTAHPTNAPCGTNVAAERYLYRSKNNNNLWTGGREGAVNRIT
jgi:hypothetical protein